MFKDFLLVLTVLFVVFVLVSLGSVAGMMQGEHSPKVRKDSLLVLDLEGVILDGKTFLKDLKKYASQDNIKGVVVRVNSPGGVVGPSQEIYAELKRVREELQKPVVVSCNAMAASGAYYAAVAADRIVTNPGSLIGSIGVIMEFANLKKLYEWAKIDRYVIKTGAFKDSGADFRPMNDEERALFQELADNVLEQFKTAIEKGRKLSADVVTKYADGRVFTGETAVKLGFADQVGTFEDALRIAGEMTGLGDKPETFYPPEKRPDFFELLSEVEARFSVKGQIKEAMPLKLLGQPLFLMPGTMGSY